MKTQLFFISICTLLLVTGCKRKNSDATIADTENTGPMEILLENVHNQKGEELLSSLNSELTYIPLETTDSSIIKGVSKLAILKNGNILITDGQSIVKLFDSSGKYIKDISQKGNGPGDYTRLCGIVSNPTTGGFFMHTLNKLIEFDADGTYINNFATEDRPMDMALDSDGNIILHRMNINKDINDTIPTWFLFKYDNSGKELKRFEDISPRLKEEGTIPLVTPIRPLYLYHKKVRFNEFGNDTLFSIEKDRLEPYAIFNLGDMKMNAAPKAHSPAEMNVVFDDQKKKLFLSYLTEDDYFLYMIFGWGFSGDFLYATYNKKNHKITNYGNGGFLTTKKGLTNDIDGCYPFFPVIIDPNGTRIMPIQASAFKEYILSLDTKVIKDKYGEKFEKVYELANNLEEEDNPVLMVVR